MAEKKKPSKTKGLAKKAAVALATLGGIALLHKHSDKIPALLGPKKFVVDAGLQMLDGVGKQEPIDQGWQMVRHNEAHYTPGTQKPIIYQVGRGISQLKHRAQLQRLHPGGGGPMNDDSPDRRGNAGIRRLPELGD